MMRNKIFFLFFFQLIFWGCSERMDLELNDSYARLVVEATLTDQANQQVVRLTKTAPYFTEQPSSGVENALVTLRDEENAWLLEQLGPGEYITPDGFRIKSGKTYHLEIDHNGILYEAFSKTPAAVPIDSLGFRPHPWLSDHYEMIIHFQEPGETRNFYKWKIYHNEKLLTNIPNKMPFSDDEALNGRYISAPIYIFQPEDGIPQPGDTIRTEMYSITEGYFDFMIAMRRYQGATGGPFTGPPANIPSNFSNGALGFFLTAGVSQQSLVLE